MNTDFPSAAKLQLDQVKFWHESPPAVSSSDPLLRLIEENHLRNFLLWHEEDKARRDDMGPDYVYKAKRAIDKFNQERNNFMEKIDELLCSLLPPPTPSAIPHTETPGMILDRLSILSLKEFHMAEEASRQDASPDHRSKCQSKLTLIRQQRSDLLSALQFLWSDVLSQKRRFNVYYQCKMYNDPSLNPQLYKKSAS